MTLGVWPATAAAAYTVTGTGDSASGVCDASACPSLRAAVAAANTNPGSTIQLGAGTYALGNGPGNPIGTGELQIYAPMTITGAGAGSTAIEQTDGENRVIDIWNNFTQGVTIDDLTITGGTLGSGASEPGAAIYAVAPLTLDGVSVSGNRETGSTPLDTGDCCQSVGAITSLNTLTIDDSSITGNSAVASPGAAGSGTGGQAVGGILATQSNPITITGSTISGNTATSGAGGSSSTLGAGGAGGDAFGAIFVIDGAPLTITGSTVADNTATAGAGGTGVSGGAGGASYGGAVFIPDATLEISSSTFDGNVATGGAGGAGTAAGGAGGEVLGGAVAGGDRAGQNAVINSTFYGNTATGGAGGSGLIAGGPGLSAGGAIAENTAQQLTIEDSTLDANVADGPGTSWGGNLFDSPTALTIADDIFSAGVAQSGADCAITAAETDDGYNLESSPDECGLSAAAHDLISADPALEPLAANGGTVETMALGMGSAAIGAGGSCLDYTQPGEPPIGTDERGVARTSPCSVGAYEVSAPGAPGGSSSGGTGGSSSSGTGSAGSGTSTDTGSSASAPGLAANLGAALVKITEIHQSATHWQVGSPAAKTAKHAAPVGTAFHFTLNTPATVTITFVRHGRVQPAGQLAIPHARAGRNTVSFSGLLAHGRRLSPGTYTATIVAVSDGHRTTSRPLRFTIVNS